MGGGAFDVERLVIKAGVFSSIFSLRGLSEKERRELFENFSFLTFV